MSAQVSPRPFGHSNPSVSRSGNIRERWFVALLRSFLPRRLLPVLAGVLLALSGAALRADVFMSGSPGYVTYVTVLVEVDEYATTGTWNHYAWTEPFTLGEYDTLVLNDSYETWQPGDPEAGYWDRWTYYSVQSVTSEPIQNDDPPPGGGGGGGGDEPLDPPVTDSPGPIFGDATHNHETISDRTLEPDPKTVEFGKAKITLSVELREMVSGQALGTESDLQGRTILITEKGLHQYRGAGEINPAAIEIEPVPGQQNMYRGKPRHIQLGSIVWYNQDAYSGSKPTLATMHAEYQHYSEYAKRLDALVEELNEILDRNRVGASNKVRNDIKRDLEAALRSFQETASVASQRYDNDNLDITDPDAGTHRGDLGRNVRVPSNFTVFPTQWPTP